MGLEKSTLLFEILDKVYPDEKTGKRVLDIDTSLAIGILPIKSFNVYDIETDYSGVLKEKGKSLKVNEIHYNRGEITFKDSDGGYVSNEIIHKLCLAKNQDVIAKIRNQVIEQLHDKKEELNNAEKIVDDKFGKYLIIAELQNE